MALGKRSVRFLLVRPFPPKGTRCFLCLFVFLVVREETLRHQRSCGTLARVPYASLRNNHRGMTAMSPLDEEGQFYKAARCRIDTFLFVFFRFVVFFFCVCAVLILRTLS